MCGRYGRWSRKQRLEILLGLIPSPESDEFERYNIVPGTHPWIVRKNSDDGVTIDSCLWGLVPFGSKNPNARVRPINAIAETAHEKPMFRELIRERRCLIPADCFYEWKATPVGKIPYCIRMADNEPFFFGGLWDEWHEGRDDAISFTILTTTPNELTAQIHNRMPVIVRAEDYGHWLDPNVRDTEKISEVFLPFPAEEMRAYPVSHRVNDAKNEGRELIQAASFL
ncbi:MAG: SOS response-associated peptidase [Pyrinomonadaceae bacterium]